MQTRRLLFVRPPRPASLAPIYVALVLLFAVSLVGFLVAYWPADPVPATSRSSGGEATTAGSAFAGALRLEPGVRERRSRGVWM